MKSIAPTEKEIENAILEYLNFQPACFAFKVNTTGIYDQRKKVFRRISRFVATGCSDIICLYKGTAIFFEVKSAKGRLSPNQKVFSQKIASSGGRYYVLRSVDDAKIIIEVLNSYK